MLEGWVVLVVLDDQVKGIKLLFHVVLGLLGFPWKRDFPLLTSVRSNNPVRTNPLPHTHNWALFALASLRASELPYEQVRIPFLISRIAELFQLGCLGLVLKVDQYLY
jgi:hypothetical protein